MPLDPYLWADLPATITREHVSADVAQYPQHRPVVTLQCRSGWASYSAHNGARLTPFRGTWNHALLDFADVVGRNWRRAA